MKSKKSILLIAGIIFTIIVLWTNYKLGIQEKDISNTAMILIELAIIVIGIVLIVFSIHIINDRHFKPEKALLFIAPIFCLIFSAVMPVGRGHDEYMHWLKAYEISEGTFFTAIKNEESLANIPRAVTSIIVERPGQIFKYTDNISMLEVKLNETDRVYKNNQNAAAYCFVQYLPQAAGIILGRAITKVPLIISYFGRAFNIITCIALMYFAIKNIPFGKNILLVLSIIPLSIEGLATLSADGITIALACLFIAYTLKIAFNQEKKCSTKQIVALTVMGGFLALCKVVYLPIIFLVLLIPKEKFENRKEKVIAVTFIILVAVILNLTWLYFGSKALVATNPEGTSTKLNQILTNPILYIERVIYTFTTNFHNYFISLFGGQLEWNEKVHIELIPYIMLALISIATIGDKKLREAFSKKQMWLIVLIVIAVVGLVFTSIFIQWTKDAIQINGVQGRYFIPILPLICLLLGRIKINTLYKEENITKFICIMGYIVMMYTAISIMAIHI